MTKSKQKLSRRLSEKEVGVFPELLGIEHAENGNTFIYQINRGEGVIRVSHMGRDGREVDTSFSYYPSLSESSHQRMQDKKLVCYAEGGSN